MADVTLTAERRIAGGKGPAGRVRREGQVPAVVYGLGEDNASVSVSARELAHILAGESGATLGVPGDSRRVAGISTQRCSEFLRQLERRWP